MTTSAFAIGYQEAMTDIAREQVMHGEAGVITWLRNNGHDFLPEVRVQLRDRQVELDLPAGNFHPGDKRRAEALTLLAPVYRAGNYGQETVPFTDAARLADFVKVLFNLTADEIEGAS